VVVVTPDEVWIDEGTIGLHREEVFNEQGRWKLDQNEVEHATWERRLIDVSSKRFVNLFVKADEHPSRKVAGLNWNFDKHFSWTQDPNTNHLSGEVRMLAVKADHCSIRGERAIFILHVTDHFEHKAATAEGWGLQHLWGQDQDFVEVVL
jgi:hypothetical protein